MLSRRQAHEAELIVDVRLDDFEGGTGLWGAVPAGYDTTRLPMDRGIHVHARSVVGKEKAIDKTYHSVRIQSNKLPNGEIIVTECEAIYYMVSTILGLQPENVLCPNCNMPHLDQDWYSVHPHCEHRCDGCGKTFQTSEAVVGNPIITVRNQCHVPAQKVFLSTKVLEIDQKQYRNGLLIWGSNPAFLWTGQHSEQEGMHVHVFGESATVPELDETYGMVRLDGIDVDAKMVRLLMAQMSLPMLRGKVAVVGCPKCSTLQFDVGTSAFTPSKTRKCSQCQHNVTSALEVVSNPALATFKKFERFAVRKPQHYMLDLPAYRPTAA